MSNLIKKHEISSEVNDSDKVYSIDKLEELFEVQELENDVYFVLNKDEDHWMDFVFLTFSYSESDAGDVHAKLLMYGSGSTGLRECRHTYWGEDGYIFYPDKKQIITVLTALEEFFDLN